MAAGVTCRLTALAALAVMAALALAACGDDDDTTVTVTTPGVSETTPAETETAAEGEGPSGALTAAGIGEVTEGMGIGEVSEIFGGEGERSVQPGCELAGPNAPKVLVERYALGDGEVLLTYDEAGTALQSYRTDSSSLETERGDRVGDPFSSVRANWGGELVAVPLGQPTAKVGFWWIQENGGRSLLFDVRGGKVAEIQGGRIAFCE